MTTDTQPQVVQDHLDYAAEVLPEITETLRLLSGRAMVLSDTEHGDVLLAVREMRDIQQNVFGLDYYNQLVLLLEDPHTRIVLVREDGD